MLENQFGFKLHPSIPKQISLDPAAVTLFALRILPRPADFKQGTPGASVDLMPGFISGVFC